MTKNVGGIDRILRIIVGIALLIGYAFNNDGAYSWLYLIGIVPLATGIFSSCLLYKFLGVNTCPIDRS